MSKDQISDIEKLHEQHRTVLLQYSNPISKALPDMTVRELKEMVERNFGHVTFLRLIGGANRDKQEKVTIQ